VHLRRIRATIAVDSATYARQTIEPIKRRTWQIKKFPLMGAIVPEYPHDDVREVLAPPYRIIYRIFPDHAVILGVIHGAQLLRATL